MPIMSREGKNVPLPQLTARFERDVREHLSPRLTPLRVMPEQERGWLRRQILLIARQLLDLFSGGALDELLAANIAKLRRGPTVASLLRMLKDMFWCGDKRPGEMGIQRRCYPSESLGLLCLAGLFFLSFLAGMGKCSHCRLAGCPTLRPESVWYKTKLAAEAKATGKELPKAVPIGFAGVPLGKEAEAKAEAAAVREYLLEKGVRVPPLRAASRLCPRLLISFISSEAARSSDSTGRGVTPADHCGDAT